MNYGKAKKILIFLFVFVNLFLIYLLIGLSGGKNELSKASVDKVIAIANEKNLSVSHNALPKRVEMLDFLELESLSSEQNINEETAFPVASANPEDVLKALNKNGSYKNYALSFLNSEQNLITGETKYSFYQTYNGYMLYGSELNAIVQKNTITTVSGTLFHIKSVNYSDFETISPLQILLDISAHYSGKGENISSVKQSYYIPPDSLTFKNLTAIPCYIIDLSSGKLFYDAVNGDFLMYLANSGNSKIFDKQQAFSSI